MSAWRKYLGFMSVPFDQALVSGANFLIIFAAARSMPVEEFGMFSLVWAAVLFLTNIHFAVYLNPLPVLLPEKSERSAGPYLSALHAIQAPFALGVTLLAVGLALWSPWDPWLIIAGGALAISRAYLENERRIGYAVGRIPLAVAVDSVACIPMAVAAVVVVALDYPFTAVQALLFTAAWAAAGYLTGQVVNRSLRRRALRAHRRAAAREHWGYGKWTLGSTLSLWGSNQAYPFILVAFTGLPEVALFNACKGVLGVIHFALQGIDAYFTPTLRRRMTQGGTTSLMEGVSQAAVITAVGAGGACVAMALFPEQLLRLFYGGKYLEGAWVLRSLALLYVLMITARIQQVVLHAMREPRAGFGASLANTTLTLTLGPILIASFGLVGAVAGLGLNYLVSVLIMGWVGWRCLQRSRAAEATRSHELEVPHVLG